MTDREMLTRLRERVGSPTTDEITDRKLRDYLVSSLQWLAGELDYHVQTLASGVALTASVYTYPLPEDLLQVLWVQWNDQYLAPGSLRQWVRDGRSWRSATAANPSEFAVEGHELTLWPPPSSTAITTDGYLALSYIAAAPELTGAGVAGLNEPDLWCAIYAAAVEYLSIRPSDANVPRMQACQAQLERRLPSVRARHRDRIEPPHVTVSVFTARSGAAR